MTPAIVKVSEHLRVSRATELQFAKSHSPPHLGKTRLPLLGRQSDDRQVNLPRRIMHVRLGQRGFQFQEASYSEPPY